jgi:cell wall-associated NlpC family hydrolase
MKAAAEKQAADARARLSKRAVEAYTGMGSQYDALLSSNSMTEFSDRLEFLGAMSQTDADLASQADSAAQQAAWAAQEYDRALADRQAKADALAADKQAASDKLAEATKYLADTQAAHDQWVQQQQQAIANPPPPPPAPTSSTQPSDPPPSGGDPFVPPPNAGAASIAVAAAESVIGAPYVFGAAGPTSFDCSGLTSWAWAQAGVSIPHSASAQYSTLPRVPLNQIVPGDIIYYGNFGPHVAIYVGGGQIVHARHPGTGGEVQYSSLTGYDTPWGAVRPG